MDQLKRLIASLGPRQIVGISVALTVAGIGLFALLRWQREADYKPLYSSLAPEDAAAMVQKLKESAIPYRLSENGTTVLVPSAKVAETRLELASAGLPKTGRIGYELFDKTNFGVTDFAEHINYQRAVEGELERSVMSLSEVEHARVHVTFPKDSVYLESRQPAKASVLVKLRPGARLEPPSVVAITHLVSSAVEGLTPEAVSVLDMRGALLNRPRRAPSPDGADPSDASLEYQQKIERDLTAKINSTLEPLLGPDKFRAGVTVDCDFSSGEQSEESYDPTRSVMVSSQKTEDISTSGGGSGGGSGGIPGAASNLPRPANKASSASSGLLRRTENVAYQSSRVVKRMKLPQGNIRRISVSVLLDHSVRWEGQGQQMRRVLVPPSADQLKTIRDLVVGVAAISPERGDRLIVETLPFESTLSAEPLGGGQRQAPATSTQPGWVEQFRKNSKWIYGGFAAVAAILLVLILRPKSKRDLPARRVSLPDGLPPAAAAGVPQPGGEAGQKLINKEHEDDLPMLPAPSESRSEILANRLRETAVNDPELCAGILRGWLAGIQNSESA